MFSTEPAPRPARITIPGRYVTLSPLNPEEHGDALWEAPDIHGTNNAGST